MEEEEVSKAGRGGSSQIVTPVTYLEKRTGKNEFRWTPRRKRRRSTVPSFNSSSSSGVPQQHQHQHQPAKPLPLQPQAPQEIKLPDQIYQYLAALRQCYPPQPAQQSRQPQLSEDDAQLQQPQHLSTSPVVWTADAHLHLCSRIQHYMELFSMISLSRVHPAILEQENVERYLSDSSDYFVTPLTLNISLALCYGAAATGDTTAEQEFWMKSREQMGELFDVDDYQVAVGLQRMSEYATNKGWKEQGQYYAVLGANVCEKVKRCDSPTYMWLLMRLYMVNDIHPEVRYKIQDAILYARNSQSAHNHNNQTSALALAQQPQLQQLQQPQQSQQLQRAQQQQHGGGECEGQVIEWAYQDLIMRLNLLYVEATCNASHLHDPGLQAQVERILDLVGEEYSRLRHLFTRGQQLRFEFIWEGMKAVSIYYQGSIGPRHHRVVDGVESEGEGEGEGEDEVVVGHIKNCCRLAQNPLYNYLPMMESGVRQLMKILREMQRLDVLSDFLHSIKSRSGGTYLDGVLQEFKKYL